MLKRLWYGKLLTHYLWNNYDTKIKGNFLDMSPIRSTCRGWEIRSIKFDSDQIIPGIFFHQMIRTCINWHCVSKMLTRRVVQTWREKKNADEKFVPSNCVPPEVTLKTMIVWWRPSRAPRSRDKGWPPATPGEPILCGSIPVSADARAEWTRWMERYDVEVCGRRKFIVHISGRLKFTAGIQSSWLKSSDTH